MKQNDADKFATALVCLLGGCGFGSWQSSLGAGIFATVLLMFIADIRNVLDKP